LSQLGRLPNLCKKSDKRERYAGWKSEALSAKLTLMCLWRRWNGGRRYRFFALWIILPIASAWILQVTK